MSSSEEKHLRAIHAARPDNTAGYCRTCGTPAPCLVIRVIDALSAAAEPARVAAALQALCDKAEADPDENEWVLVREVRAAAALPGPEDAEAAL